MRRKSVSPQSNDREWLHAIYEIKKHRSFEIGLKAIDALVKESQPVSYRSVAAKSKEIDPDGEGIHQNTIKKNVELHNYFLQHSTAKAYKPRKRFSKPRGYSNI